MQERIWRKISRAVLSGNLRCCSMHSKRSQDARRVKGAGRGMRFVRVEDGADAFSDSIATGSNGARGGVCGEHQLLDVL